MLSFDSNHALGHPPRRDRIWAAGFIILPYASYLGLLVMAVLFCQALWQRGKQVLKHCMQQGFGWLSIGLLISCSAAFTNKGDAFLQLTNFLPFFVFFSVLAMEPTVLQQPFLKLEVLARWLLLTSIPLTILSIAQYLLTEDLVDAYSLQDQYLLNWIIVHLYNGTVDRANALFSNANTLCAYLLILFGLGLGLLLKQLEDLAQKQDEPHSTSQSIQRWLERLSVVLCASAIFGTGSRAGLAAALVLIAITLYAARRHRWVLLTGLVGGGALVAAAGTLGVGGRSLSLAMFGEDARGPLWQIAFRMIRERPWLGWGLGGLRSQYVPGSINDHPMLFHAHNIWLFFASEMGIPVMIGFCIVIGRICYLSTKAFIQQPHPPAHRALFLGYLLAWASCVLYGILDVVLFDSRVNVLSWSVLAATYVLGRAQPKPV